MSGTPRKAAILAAIDEGARTMPEIRSATRIETPALAPLLLRLVRAGELKRSDKDRHYRYEIPPEGYRPPRKPSLDWRREPPDASNEGQVWLLWEEDISMPEVGRVSVEAGEVVLVLPDMRSVLPSETDEGARWARVPLP